MQGSGYFCEVVDELVVEVAEADELMDTFDIMWGLPLMDGINLDTLHFETIGGEFNTKEVHLGFVELTLLRVEGDTCLTAALEEGMVGGDVLSHGFVVGVGIIKVPNKVVD